MYRNSRHSDLPDFPNDLPENPNSPLVVVPIPRYHSSMASDAGFGVCDSSILVFWVSDKGFGSLFFDPSHAQNRVDFRGRKARRAA